MVGPDQAGDGLGRWLKAHGLEAWHDVLAAEQVEVGDLPHLTADDLAQLGLPLGPRRRLLAAAADPGADAAPVVDGISGAERRVLTVAFFDLVGSTALSDRLGTEELREVISRYQELVTEVVTDHGGHVAKYLGDGTLAYFGWPTASTDQAAMAIRSAKRVTDLVPSVRVEGVDAELAGRAGIATGEVILGDIAGEKDAIVGRTANLAARLEGQAPSGGVAIEARTAALTGRRFELESAGSAELKGLEEAVEILIVGDEQVGLSRFAGATLGTEPGSMVGRDDELTRLRDRWAVASSGSGGVCAISGEAGVGKSRLVHELVSSIDDARILMLQCAPEWSLVPLRPLVQWVEVVSGAVGAESADEWARSVSSHLVELGLQQGDAEFFLQLAPAHRTIDRPADEAAAGHDRLLGSLTELLVGDPSGPTVLVVEDLHWADPTTLDLLGRIAKRSAKSAALVVLTHRTDWSLPKRLARTVESIELGALTAESIGLVVRSSASVADDELREVIEQSGGNPFYAREYATFLTWRRERGDAEVPFSLATSLLGQLDGLGPSKRVAQVASAIGRRFDGVLLAAMVGVDPGDVDALVEPLVYARVVVPAGSVGSFDFVHALVQEAAYDSLLAADRRVLHGRAVDAARASGRVPAQVIATHAGLAGRFSEALTEWRAAADQALSSGASAEAIQSLNAALAALDECDDAVGRGGAERLEILLQLAPATMVVRGYASESARTLYREAVDLALALDDRASHFTAVWGGYYTTEVRADFHQSAADIEELLALDPSSLPEDLSIQIDHAAATHFGSVGPFDVAAHHSRRMVDLYDQELHCEHRHLFGAHDPGVCGHGQLGAYELMLANPGVAEELGREAVALGERLGHPPSTAIGLMFDSWIGVLGEADDAAERVDRAVAFCTQHGVSAVGLTVDLYRRALITDPERRHAALFERLGPMQAAGATGLFVPSMAGLAADAALGVDELDQAIAMLDYADDVIERTAQFTARPFVLRLRGDAVLALGDADAADEVWRRALHAASEVQCLWEQLRITRAWVPSLRARGRDMEATQLLESVDSLVDRSASNPVVAAVAALG